MGAALSSALRWLLVLKGGSISPALRSFFFSRLVQATGTYRLSERIAFHFEPLGHRRYRQPFIEQSLGLDQHRRGEHRRSAPSRRGIKPFRALVSITLHSAFDTDCGYPDGAHNLHLFGVAVDTKLGRDEAKSSHIVLGVDKHRHVPVEVGHLTVFSLKGQFPVNVLHPVGEKRQVHLRHRWHLSKPVSRRHQLSPGSQPGRNRYRCKILPRRQPRTVSNVDTSRKAQ